jgi:hypothetical protein
MTVATARVLRPFIGMTVEQAAAYMRNRWDRFHVNKDIPLHPVKGSREIDLRHYSPSRLQADLRDCGWCLGHSGGTNAMAQAHDLAIKGLRWNDQGHDFSRAIDFAFHGIASWIA